MADLVFDPPRRVRINSEKYRSLSRVLLKMGYAKPEFAALRVTSDGKVIPDPKSLDASVRGMAAPVVAKVVDFDDDTLQQLRDHGIVVQPHVATGTPTKTARASA